MVRIVVLGRERSPEARRKNSEDPSSLGVSSAGSREAAASAGIHRFQTAARRTADSRRAPRPRAEGRPRRRRTRPNPRQTRHASASAAKQAARAGRAIFMRRSSRPAPKETRKIGERIAEENPVRAVALLGLRREAIADPGLRPDEAGPVRIGLELAAKAAHVDAQRVGRDAGRRSPDRGEQLLVRPDAARLRREREEQAELGRRQMDRLACPPDRPRTPRRARRRPIATAGRSPDGPRRGGAGPAPARRARRRRTASSRNRPRPRREAAPSRALRAGPSGRGSGTAEVRRIRRTSSRPSSFGMFRSVTTRSNCARPRRAATASSPSTAVSTSCPAFSSASRTTLRIAASSSATRIRLTRPPAEARSRRACRRPARPTSRSVPPFISTRLRAIESPRPVPGTSRPRPEAGRSARRRAPGPRAGCPIRGRRPAEGRCRSSRGRRDADLASGRGVAGGVLEAVAERLGQLAGVHLDAQLRAGHVDEERVRGERRLRIARSPPRRSPRR